MNKSTGIAVGIVVVLLLAGGAYLYANPGIFADSEIETDTNNQTVCTLEAKQCPDGSYVGRTGPNCEFAECPVTHTTGTVKVGDRVTINGVDIAILELVEDSRCPVDVQCIQAGTVRVRAAINAMNRDFTFTLGQAQAVGGVDITLISVVPAQKNSKVTVSPSDYIFTFSVTNTADKG